MGYLYHRKLKNGERSAIYWVKYYVNGRPVRVSTGSEKEGAARDFLKIREGAAAEGKPIPPRIDKVRYDELAEDLRRHYATTGRRDLREAGFRFKRLGAFFRGRYARDITSTLITDYVLRRQEQKAANGTINRELATLSRMLRLAYFATPPKIARLPRIDRLEEAPPRSGFFEPEQYQAVRSRLAEDLKAATLIAYTYGWRMDSEVLLLERRQLNLEAGTLRLDAGSTKNDDGRIVYLTAEVELALREQVARVDALQRRLGRIIPWLFPNLRGRLRVGQPRRDIRSAWKTACKQAGVPSRIPHDFRRTAVRNMVNAGVPERVAMKVTGHKTRSVFDRYHIVSPADLQDVARKLTGTFSGHTGPSTAETSLASMRN
jgi:integrase